MIGAGRARNGVSETREREEDVELGFFTEFHCPAGMSEPTAFEESMAQMRMAEALGFDAVWLGELHFQKDRSVLASPLVVAAAIAARTRRVRIGIAVQVLPLSHPLRLAEDVATVDHLSRGRLDFGVGRSGLPGHYQGFNVPYEESRGRFAETLEILLKAWTQERFSHEGPFYRFHDVCLLPKPYQKPHPPIRIAATTEETYPMVGRLGYPVFVAVRTGSIADLRRLLGDYHAAWGAAGHPGRGEVALLVPVYVAETAREAREDAEASTMHWFRAIARALADSPTRRADAARLARLSYDEVLGEQVVYGTPEAVAERLGALREELGFSSLSTWMNVGGQVPRERVLRSMRLFADRVAPRLA
jgi:alkanesulfonate monooxygenase SsuD/methylene tetrahydromethanopterin reductase-like flavin-dependent oxidoreductase (luciferase family)